MNHFWINTYRTLSAKYTEFRQIVGVSLHVGHYSASSLDSANYGAIGQKIGVDLEEVLVSK